MADVELVAAADDLHGGDRAVAVLELHVQPGGLEPALLLRQVHRGVNAPRRPVEPDLELFVPLGGGRGRHRQTDATGQHTAKRSADRCIHDSGSPVEKKAKRGHRRRPGGCVAVVVGWDGGLFVL
jgi:hypothetical protein